MPILENSSPYEALKIEMRNRIVRSGIVEPENYQTGNEIIKPSGKIWLREAWNIGEEVGEFSVTDSATAIAEYQAFVKQGTYETALSNTLEVIRSLFRTKGNSIILPEGWHGVTANAYKTGYATAHYSEPWYGRSILIYLDVRLKEGYGINGV